MRAGLSGFTLIEILMVILLTSILMTVGVTQFIDFQSDARGAVTRDRLKSMAAAITGDARFVAGGKFSSPGYENHCGGLPSSTTLGDLVIQPVVGICAAVYNPFTKIGWRGPYLSTADPNWDKDSWGITIQYFSAIRKLRSCGNNKSCGNPPGNQAVDDNDDISISF